METAAVHYFAPGSHHSNIHSSCYGSVDLSLVGSSKGNLFLYHECVSHLLEKQSSDTANTTLQHLTLFLQRDLQHGGWNQKFSYNSKTEQIKTGDKCWDYNLETGNLYGRSCHQWSNQKWYIDDLGRIRSKRDHKCVDIRNGNDMYLRD